jgi:four helix bundle protein
MKNLKILEHGFAFGKLVVYQKGKAFYFSVKELLETEELSKNHKDQLSRAALSIPLNIAEGTSRSGLKDRRRFWVIARGSLLECVALVDILLNEKLIDAESAEKILFEASEISKMLFAMIDDQKKLKG